jgi:hypothetical protein
MDAALIPFSDVTGPARPFSFSLAPARARLYANTGLDIGSRNQPFAFYDVADGDAMLNALGEARSPQPLP